MISRRLVILKLLACTAGGAVLTPVLLWLIALLRISRNNVVGSDIPALAGVGALYGMYLGILWAYKHKMENNRTAQKFYAVGFMLGAVFGLIFGIAIASPNGNDQLSSAFMGFLPGAAAVIFVPALAKKMKMGQSTHESHGD